MMFRIFTIFSFLLTSICCFAQNNFDAELQKILSQPDYKNASVGIRIIDLEKEMPLFSLNAEKLLIPASTLKIITSATALEILGAGYRFKTKIGYSGEIENSGQLTGNLVIIGGGDPTLGSAYFNTNPLNDSFVDCWVQNIKAAGIRRINGNIILDGSLYDTDNIPSSWVWGDIGNYYGAGPGAFTCYDNLFRITFKSPEKSGEATEITAITPAIEGLRIKNEVISSDDKRDLANVFGSPFDNERVIRGSIPKNRTAFTIKAAVHHPEELIARELVQKLTKEGILFTGMVKFETIDKSKVHIIYIHESPALKDIIKILNHESVNLIAEHLVLQLAAEKTGTGNREKGIEIIKDFWKSKGIIEDDFFMEDGSGLSHFNAVSPNQITSILVYTYQKSENKDVFINSLPNAGVGTLSGFNTGFFQSNTLKAKSGSMTRVRCYSGYLDCNPNKKVAFTIMFNHFSGSNLKLTKEVEKLLLIIKKSM